MPGLGAEAEHWWVAEHDEKDSQQPSHADKQAEVSERECVWEREKNIIFITIQSLVLSSLLTLILFPILLLL